MGVIESVRDLRGVAEHINGPERPAREAVVQRLALEVLHDDERAAVLLADIEQRADVRMTQRGDRARFGLKSTSKVGPVGQITRQELDGHRPIQPRIARLVHLAHPARADERQDFVRAESDASGEPHLTCRVGSSRTTLAR